MKKYGVKNPYTIMEQMVLLFQYLIKTMKVGASITLATNMQFFYQEAKDAWSAIYCLSARRLV